MNLHVLTANRLIDGAVVYFTPKRTWSQWFGDAVVCENADDAEALLRDSCSGVQSTGVVDPYLIDVHRESETIKPTRYREVIRARGPSVFDSAHHEDFLTPRLGDTTAQAA